MYLATYFFGWMATATIRLLIVAVVIVGVLGALQAVQEKRRKQGAVEKKTKPSFYDQVMQEMTQFDEAIQRGLKRSAERALAGADLTAEVWHEDPETEQAVAAEDQASEEQPAAAQPQRGFARALAAAAGASGANSQTEQAIETANQATEEQPAVPPARKAKARAAAAGSDVSVEVPHTIPPSWVGSDKP